MRNILCAADGNARRLCDRIAGLFSGAARRGFLVNGHVAVGDRGPVEISGTGEGVVSERIAKGGVGREEEQGGGEGFGILRGDEEAVVVVLDNFGDAADAGSDDRFSRGHGFKIDDALGFVPGGEHEEITAGEEGGGLSAVGAAEEMDTIGEVEGAR